MNLDKTLALKIREQASHGFAGGADDLGDLFVGEGQYHSGLAVVRSTPGCKIEQEPGQLFFYGSGEPQAADLAIGGVVDIAQSLGNPQRHFPVGPKKLEEGFSGNEIGLD